MKERYGDKREWVGERERRKIRQINIKRERERERKIYK